MEPAVPQTEEKKATPATHKASIAVPNTPNQPSTSSTEATQAIAKNVLRGAIVEDHRHYEHIATVLQQYIHKCMTQALQVENANIQALIAKEGATINLKLSESATAQIAKNLNAQSEQLQALAKHEKMQQLIQSIKQKYQRSNEITRYV